jgi:tRNA (guanine-N7-)-methyltransferase
MNRCNKLTENIQRKKQIKSYVCRSRMTTRQRSGLDQYWSMFGIETLSSQADFSQLFGRKAPTFLEIGFGMGTSLVQLAMANPDVNFVGIEVHRPGVGSLLTGINHHRIENIRIFCADAISVLEKCIPDDSLSGLLLFFPDPWPKRRHHKRRIVQPDFVNLIHKKLITNGYFHLVTDIIHYANHISSVVNSHQGFHNVKEQLILPKTMHRPKTKFELRGENMGHVMTDLIYVKGSVQPLDVRALDTHDPERLQVKKCIEEEL